MTTISKTWVMVGGISLSMVAFLGIFLPIVLTNTEENMKDPYEIAIRVLESVPLVDGHNDLPNNLRGLLKNKLSEVDFRKNLTLDPVWGTENCASCFTDIPRLRAGRLSSQFWVAYVSCKTQYKDAVEQTLEQIDVIRQMVNQYSDEMVLVTTSQGILDAFESGKIGSLIGVEGGHSIDSRLAALRIYYEMGTRYMTLTHSCVTPWVDASPVDAPGGTPVHNGLTDFGKKVIREMNRLGIMVDLSHTSKKTQIDAIQESRAPIIYSHSDAFELCNHHRNVHDDVLKLVTENNGIVMANFYNGFVACGNNATLEDVAGHINHIRKIAGVNHVGIGGDYDGIEMSPTGLEDVSKYPDLFAYLAAGTGDDAWTEEELKKLAGLNLIRVFKDVERVRDEIATEGTTPDESWIPVEDLGNNTGCMTL